MPAGLASLASNRRWLPARHLRLLNQRLLDVAAGRCRRLMIHMPPRHGKSMLTSQYFPAWYLGRFPDRRFILASYEASFAATWGRKARDVMEEYGADLFGVEVRGDSSAADRWDLAGREGGMNTAGVGGPLTGKGAHILLIDDPVKNAEEARSPTIREKHKDWFRSVTTTRLEPGGAEILIMTRWNRDDLGGWAEARGVEDGQPWEVLSLPALALDNDPLGRAPGEALWPERYPVERLHQLRQTTEPYWWAALYQQDPQAEGGTEWPASYFGPSIWFHETPRFVASVLALDPSQGKGERGCYAAYVHVGLDIHQTVWVDAWLSQEWDAVRLVDEGVELCRRLKPGLFSVECSGQQGFLLPLFETRAQAEGLTLPLYAFDPTPQNKEVRIRELGPLLAKGRLRFRAEQRGSRLLVRQLRDFPVGEFVDGPDALQQALVGLRVLLEGRGQKGPTRVRT